jgi:hypothetical protein
MIIAATLLSGCGERGYDGHSDGEMPVTIRVLVRDSQTQRGLERVKVTFFHRRDVYAIKLATVMRERGQENAPPFPLGLSAETDLSGKTIMQCQVRAAFLFRGSSERIVKEQWWGGGMFRFEKAGYESMEKQLDDFFPSPPYVGRVAPAPIVVELKRKN